MRPTIAFFRRWATLLCAAWVLMDGLFLLAAGLGWQTGLISLSPLLPFSSESWALRLASLVFAFPAFALVILAALNPKAESVEEDQIQLDNERGKVRLSARTLSDYLQKKSATLEGVDSVRIKVNSAPSGKVALEVEASVYADESLPVVTQRIQDHIEAELKGTIGVAGIEGVSIRFRKIADFQPMAALPAPQAPSNGQKEAETIELKSPR